MCENFNRAWHGGWNCCALSFNMLLTWPYGPLSIAVCVCRTIGRSGHGWTAAYRVKGADVVQAGRAQDDLVEGGHRAADQARVAALRHHRQPPRVAVRQHLQSIMSACNPLLKVQRRSVFRAAVRWLQPQRYRRGCR